MIVFKSYDLQFLSKWHDIYARAGKNLYENYFLHYDLHANPLEMQSSHYNLVQYEVSNTVQK